MALNELHGVHSSCKCFIEQDGQVDLPVPGGKATNIALFDNDLYLCLICSGSYRAPPPRKHPLLENNEPRASLYIRAVSELNYEGFVPFFGETLDHA